VRSGRASREARLRQDPRRSNRRDHASRAHHEPAIRSRFGDPVADIVLACTDGDAVRKAKEKDASQDERRRLWRIRKQAYLEHLGDATASTRLVSCCDKLHNARAIVTDLETIGTAVFDRFNASREGTLWYYGAIASSFIAHRTPPAAELGRTVHRMRALSEAVG
jgi:hypothetical protein